MVDILDPARRDVAARLDLCRKPASYVDILVSWRDLEVLDALENLLLAHGLPGVRLLVEETYLVAAQPFNTHLEKHMSRHASNLRVPF